MITNMNKILFAGLVGCALTATLTSCSNFLEEQVPQATLTQDEVKDPKYIDNVIISAYAGLVTIEDMNASFSHCGTTTPVLTMLTLEVLSSLMVSLSTVWKKVLES